MRAINQSRYIFELKSQDTIEPAPAQPKAQPPTQPPAQPKPQPGQQQLQAQPQQLSEEPTSHELQKTTEKKGNNNN